MAASAPAPAAAAAPSGSRLAAHASPLVAGEPGSVAALLARLEKVRESLPEGSPHRVSAEDWAQLQGFPQFLASASSPAQAAVICAVLAKVLRTWPREQAAFPALCLLRLLALRKDCIGFLIATTTTSSSKGAAAAASSSSSSAPSAPSTSEEGGVLWDVLETASLSKDMYGAAANGKPGPASVMALAALANAFKTEEGQAWASRHPDVRSKLIDTAVRTLSSQGERADLRQMAAAVAYNLCLCLPIGSDSAGEGVPLTGLTPSSTPGDATVLVTDSSVQLLCALLENCQTESDAETLRRRLLGAGKLLQREGIAAGELMATLGMGEGPRAVAEGEAVCTKGTAAAAGGPAVSPAASASELKALAAEVAALIVPLSAF